MRVILISAFLVVIGFAQPVRTNNDRYRNQTTFSGILLDAACEDRNPENLRRAAEPLPGPMPADTTPPPPDVAAHRVPDIRTRQEDPSCAVTGSTRSFILLLDDGHLLDLDSGGDTFALQAVQSSSQGRAMLNGKAPGFKPRVNMQGHVRGDRLLVEKIVKLG